jgi:TetR/AcrR family transcriptional regulator, transcriptional repressor of bet genes
MISSIPRVTPERGAIMHYYCHTVADNAIIDFRGSRPGRRGRAGRGQAITCGAGMTRSENDGSAVAARAGSTPDRAADRRVRGEAAGVVTPSVTTMRRAQILCASIQIVGRKGALGARLKDIATEAEVSLGLVQHYFGTRHELMEQTFRVMLSISLDRVRAVAARDPDPLLTLVSMLQLHTYGSVDFAERWGFWVEMWSSARRDPALADIAHKIYDLWTVPFEDTITGLQHEGRCRTDLTASEAAVLVMGLIDGLAVRSLIDPETLTVEQMYASLLTASFAVLGISTSDQDAVMARVAERPTMTLASSPLSAELVSGFLES